MMNQILKSVSCDVEITFICHFTHKNALKNLHHSKLEPFGKAQPVTHPQPRLNLNSATQTTTNREAVSSEEQVLSPAKPCKTLPSPVKTCQALLTSVKACQTPTSFCQPLPIPPDHCQALFSLIKPC
ncbi:hypothetical protein E2C01_015541 [Portunus trituberculatus]|uniref:Uncharacterized protein n=1 Tax=Portunus trituberculatus TaxID=210409 RepID=A0A5B7DNC4_PORTR|nr:hypothetical protein [Portunus trituberculatus]